MTRHHPAQVLESKFEAALKRFSAEFQQSEAFQHAATRGTERERPVREFFSNHLPKAYDVASGEVVDKYNTHSPQLDVIIYNCSRNYAFHEGVSVILPAEALLVSIEVKTTLTRDEIRTSLEAAKKLHELRPFDEEPAEPKRAGEHRDYKCRYFHCIFAYKTDLGADNWLENEVKRCDEVAMETGVDVGYIDRVYVAGRGLLNLRFRKAFLEDGEEGRALMQFYLHILNFIEREDRAREPVPVMDYAGSTTSGWRGI